MDAGTEDRETQRKTERDSRQGILKSERERIPDGGVGV
jgi:hypothetical protein